MIALALLAAVSIGAGAGALPDTAQTACYVPPVPAAPLASPASATVEGRPILSDIPSHPRGIIYLFHGTGGSERFALRLQTMRTLAPLVAAGYGYVAAPSGDRTAKRWDVTSADPVGNADIAFMLSLHRALIAKGRIAAATPVFAMGMSNGGAFANMFAGVAKRAGLPVRAVADYFGPFPEALRAAVVDGRQYPPTMVVLGRNDGYVDTDRVAAIAGALVHEGATMPVYVNAEHPVCAATFAAIPGIDPAAAAMLVARTLPGAGLIDASGRRTAFRDHATITPDDMADVRRRLADVPQGREIAALLFVAWAAHEMRDDYAAQQRALFDAALTP